LVLVKQVNFRFACGILEGDGCDGCDGCFAAGNGSDVGVAEEEEEGGVAAVACG
jgi:hypothetical protein